MADTQLACADHHGCNSSQMFNREKPGGLQSRRLSGGPRAPVSGKQQPAESRARPVPQHGVCFSSGFDL